MKGARLSCIVLALCTTALGSASAQTSADLQIPTTESDGGPERTAALNGRMFRALIQPLNNSTVTGIATMAPADEPGTTLVTVSLIGADPGTYYWHLYVGSCESPGALLGDRSQYRSITVGDDGRAVLVEEMAFEPPSGGNYNIVIHESADPPNQAKVVACGALLETGV